MPAAAQFRCHSDINEPVFPLSLLPRNEHQQRGEDQQNNQHTGKVAAAARL
jgi:hypothetical protein